ncbi:hypothetical protein HUT06_28775 [Actinomadura sp. NAK00032]|uniref:hypothetical protein n=1 Tax=Actinomadura sp. NAK00032 TaxID=2742128 RepID=UPI001592550B|nr:hypothetical protein [Actinomadura sp. NAK00032]QKW37509.1 hypothetical protein HUT06_28775 [Actinomadura sp. NAK00032]
MERTNTLRGRAVLITGGGTGIGRVDVLVSNAAITRPALLETIDRRGEGDDASARAAVATAEAARALASSSMPPADRRAGGGMAPNGPRPPRAERGPVRRAGR